MPNLSAIAASAASPSLVLSPDPATAIVEAARLLLPHLERGQRIDAIILRAAMETAFDACDTSGVWDWKAAYDACEVATILFLRKYGKALLHKAGSPAALMALLDKIAGLLPTHTRRSEESQKFQQFSTPLALGFAASSAAAITPSDLVLEPSAGTGLLAILAELAGGALHPGKQIPLRPWPACIATGQSLHLVALPPHNYQDADRPSGQTQRTSYHPSFLSAP